MSGDISACVCVDIGPVLVKPGPQAAFLFVCLFVCLFVFVFLFPQCIGCVCMCRNREGTRCWRNRKSSCV